MINNDNSNKCITVENLEALTAEEFLSLGFGGLSYIKSIGQHDGHSLFALHGADGSHIATGQDVPTLRRIAVENHLVPMGMQ